MVLELTHGEEQNNADDDYVSQHSLSYIVTVGPASTIHNT